MSRAMLLVRLLLAAMASSGGAATVYVMRHCARATYYPDLRYVPFPFLSNYSDGGALPDWGVGPALCTDRGRRIITDDFRRLHGAVA